MLSAFCGRGEDRTQYLWACSPTLIPLSYPVRHYIISFTDRLSAIYGGTYMLDKPDCKIVYDETGKAVGVQDAEGAVAKCDVVVCDPSYAEDKCKPVGKVSQTLWGMLNLNQKAPSSHFV
jgi:Rab GDP dissociation inhibitor